MWVWLITPRAPSRGAQQACGGCRHPARRSRAGARRHCLLVPTARASTIDLRRAADAGKWAKWLSKTQPCVMHFAGNIKTGCRQRSNAETTPVGFEPTRGDPIGLAGRRLNGSAKVSTSTHTRINRHVHILGTLIRGVGQVARALHRFLDKRRSGPAGSLHSWLVDDVVLRAVSLARTCALARWRKRVAARAYLTSPHLYMGQAMHNNPHGLARVLFVTC